MKRWFVLFLVGVVICCAVWSASAEPVKLAYKFTKGELDKYRSNISVTITTSSGPGKPSIPPIVVTMETVQQSRTLEVLPDGSAKVRVSHSISSVSVSGVPKGKTPAVPKQSFSLVYTMSPQGRITSVEGAQNLQKMFESAGLRNFDMSFLTNQMASYVLLPEEPIDIGSTWKQVIPLPLGWGEVSVESTLDSYGEKIWSQTAARISQKFTGRMDLGQVVRSLAGSMASTEKERQAASQITGTMDMNGTMTFLFAPELGKILKGSGQMWAEMTLNMPGAAVAQGAPSQMQMHMDMKCSITRFK
ncbi:MAG: hypothetical protein QHI38_03605 [Armatimonadota bacterium]|nr:hypothetical protein [Armatimonadota bacterium]